jgi:glycosyltransferase involved in cell wall biosynthesis
MTAPEKKLSLAMIVKNEARCLARCLRSVASIVDEIVIVDTGSTDSTVHIAGEFNATIAHFNWSNDFSAARNFALAQATGDWILVLDADEFASTELAAEIRKFIQGPPQIGRLKIVSDFRRNGQTQRSQSFVSRLFPRGAQFEGLIHEQIVSPLPRVNLRGELSHDGYLETQKSDRNIKLLLAELAAEPSSAYLLFQLALEHTSLDQPDKAFVCLQKALAFMRPTDQFAPNIVVDFLYAAVALKKFAEGLKVIAWFEDTLDDFPDFHHVCGLFYMNLIRSDTAGHISDMPKIEQSFRRCLALGETDKYKSVHGTGTFLANYNLGVFYHVLDNPTEAQRCFEAAANQGYEPAVAMLKKLKLSLSPF